MRRLVAGTEYDQLFGFDGSFIELGGTLEIDLIGLGGDIFTPEADQIFDLIVADEISGEFSNFVMPALEGGMFFDLQMGLNDEQREVLRLVVVGQIRNGVVVGVAEPGSLALFAIGLVGFAAMLRRKARGANA
jgi:hypothetical protein